MNRQTRQESIYKILLETSPDAVYALDGVVFEYVNPMGCKLLGYEDQGELIGKNVLETVHPDYRQLIKDRALERQRGEDPPHRYEAKLLKRDGTPIDVEFNISITEIDGKRLTITYARNIEERVRHRSQLKALYFHINKLTHAETLEEIINTTLDAMSQALEFEFSSFLQVIGNNLVINSNEQFIQSLTLPLRGKGLTVQAANSQQTIITKDTRKEPNYIMGSVTSLSEIDVPVTMEGKTVAVLNVEQNTVNAFNEDHKTLLETLASHVSTAYYRLEKEKQLEEVKQKHIRDLVENYRKMSTMVRHDLRSPLQAIYNAAEILSRDPNQVEMKVLLNNQIKYIESILEDWKQQTLNGEIIRKEENILQIIQVAIKSAAIPESIRVNIDIDENLLYNIDYNRMLRALTNLIRNSNEAMPNGGTLTISASVDCDRLEICVKDTGAGISDKNMDWIYDPFFTTKPKGMGLGLSFVRQVVEAHKGDINISSKEGKGTTILIRIPSI